MKKTHDTDELLFHGAILQRPKIGWFFVFLFLVCEVSRHNAVLFVPEDLTKIAFWDLYATGMPIFVPDSKILSKLLCFEENSLEKMHYFDNNARHPFVKTGQFEDLEPFNLKTHCARKLQLWAPLADYYQFPHVYLGFEARRLEISLDWKKKGDSETKWCKEVLVL